MPATETRLVQDQQTKYGLMAISLLVAVLGVVATAGALIGVGDIGAGIAYGLGWIDGRTFGAATAILTGGEMVVAGAAAYGAITAATGGLATVAIGAAF
ncbi:MAG: hypothetical protein ABEI99_01985 [Halobaculum sp.]